MPFATFSRAAPHLIGLLALIFQSGHSSALAATTVLGAGGGYACQLADGVVRCWGRDTSGELGDGQSGFGKSSPRVVALPELVVGVTVKEHACAWGVSGRLWCWGRSSSGELGPNASGPEISVPVEVPVPPIVGAAAGGVHTCASTTDGVWCWGANEAGQLGNGHQSAFNEAQPEPTRVLDLSGAVVALAANGWHTCAIIEGGSLQCWGDNSFGQLGTHAADVSASNPVALTPVTVPLPLGVADVSLGIDHTCALLVDGAVWCWGHNGYGQSGGAVPGQEQAPLRVLASDAASVSAGAFHTCARMLNGAVECWGDNALDELGVSGEQVAWTSEPVMAIVSGAADVASGGIFTCSTGDDGKVRCWGSDLNGALGDGIRGGYSTFPRKVRATGISRVSGGLGHACAVLTNADAECWGFNWFGVLGSVDAPLAEAWLPVAVTNDGEGVQYSAVEAGGIHTCASDTVGVILCWGGNDSGQLGGAGGWPETEPVLVPLALPVLQIAVGNAHSCAAIADAPARCWGAGSHGQLGTGVAYADGTSQPQPVKGPDNEFVEIAAGYLHTCARTSDGRIFCWGDDSVGQIGDGVVLPSTTTRLEPVEVSGLPEPAIAVSAGGYQSCAVMQNGTPYCWGALASLAVSTAPQAMPMFSHAVKRIAIGGRHFCALLSTEQVECAGQNDVGQAGRADSPAPSLSAAIVALPENATSLTAGDDFTCASVSNGDAYCWGSNAFGELGSGEHSHRWQPAVVVGLPLLTDGFESD